MSQSLTYFSSSTCPRNTSPPTFRRNQRFLGDQSRNQKLTSDPGDRSTTSLRCIERVGLFFPYRIDTNHECRVSGFRRRVNTRGSTKQSFSHRHLLMTCKVSER